MEKAVALYEELREKTRGTNLFEKQYLVFYELDGRKFEGCAYSKEKLGELTWSIYNLGGKVYDIITVPAELYHRVHRFLRGKRLPFTFDDVREITLALMREDKDKVLEILRKITKE